MNLTDEQLRVEVCKVMGWKLHTQPDGEHVMVGPELGVVSNDLEAGEWDIESLPPLTLDLMWEAEETLTGIDHLRYVQELTASRPGMMLSLFLDLCHATATQRARAFLKVKGVEL